MTRDDYPVSEPSWLADPSEIEPPEEPNYDYTTKRPPTPLPRLKPQADAVQLGEDAEPWSDADDPEASTTPATPGFNRYERVAVGYVVNAEDLGLKVLEPGMYELHVKPGEFHIRRYCNPWLDPGEELDFPVFGGLRVSPLVRTVLLAVVCLFAGSCASSAFGQEPPVTPLTPKAEITDMFGQPLPNTYAAGSVLILSAAKAVHGDNDDSIIWSISPPSIDQRSQRFWDRKRGPLIVIPVGLSPPSEITVVQFVALGSSGNAATVTLKLSGVPPDDPTPPTPISLTDQTRKWITTVPASSIGRKAAIVSGLKSVIAAIGTNKVATIEELEQLLAATLLASVDSDKGWDVFGASYNQAIATRKVDGTIRDVATYAAAINQVIKGLE